MAGKPQNRRELRRQYDAAEPLDPMEEDAVDAVEADDDEEEKKPKKKKAPAKPKAKAVKAVKAVKPSARMRIVWTVTNDAFKPVGTFDFSQKDAADARAAELTAKGKGTHFVQKTKEPMPDNAPGLGAAIPRPAPVVEAVVVQVAEVAVEDEEEIEDEDEADEAEEEDEEE